MVAGFGPILYAVVMGIFSLSLMLVLEHTDLLTKFTKEKFRLIMMFITLVVIEVVSILHTLKHLHIVNIQNYTVLGLSM